MKLRWEHVLGGWEVFDSRGKKLAVLHTCDHAGVLNGAMIWKVMPRESWQLSFTSPVQHLHVVEAVLAQIPPGPGGYQS